jgi:intracellular sulfur oxidation DsrE/DsrF family protein
MRVPLGRGLAFERTLTCLFPENHFTSISGDAQGRIGALAFEGDLPASIFHLQLIANDIADADVRSEVIAVFHTNAGLVTLHDIAYNADRNIATGNPYKDLVADLIKRGVHVELCRATTKAHNRGNADLLPGIKVNTEAMARTTQLGQEGFVKITE